MEEPTETRSFKTGSYFAFFQKLRTVNIYNNTEFDFLKAQMCIKTGYFIL